MKASCDVHFAELRIFFLAGFCLSSSLRLREMSPRSTSQDVLAQGAMVSRACPSPQRGLDRNLEEVRGDQLFSFSHMARPRLSARARCTRWIGRRPARR